MSHIDFKEIESLTERLRVLVNDKEQRSESLRELYRDDLSRRVTEVKTLAREYQNKKDQLKDLKSERKSIFNQIPQSIIERRAMLKSLVEQRTAIEERLAKTETSSAEINKEYESLMAIQSDRQTKIDKFAQENRALVEQWAKVLNLHIESAPKNRLKITFTDLQKSFFLNVGEGSIHAEAVDLPQRELLAISEKFNARGEFATLFSSIRQLYIAHGENLP